MEKPAKRFRDIPTIRLVRYEDGIVICAGTGTIEEAIEYAKKKRPGVEIAFVG